MQKPQFQNEDLIDIISKSKKEIVALDELIESNEKNKTNNIEQNIKTENMIWDTSKGFRNAVYSDSRHLAPIPSVINSSFVEAKVSPSVSAYVGQKNLYNANTPSLLFIRANESTYNTGSVISYNSELLNISIGSYSSSYNHTASGGATLALKPLKLPFNTGSLTFGGGCFQNEQAYDYKTTGGLFGEYAYKRLKLNAQVGQSAYSNSNVQETSLYFVPEVQLTNSVSLKTRLIRNVTRDINQDELVLTYTPKRNLNNLTLELNASNQYTPNSNIHQRFKFSTSFKI